MNGLNIDSERKGILRNLEELEEAENRKDIEGLLELVTDDFVFLYRDSKIEGKPDFKKMLEGAVQNYISSKHIPLRIEISASGDMAWLSGYELNRRTNGNGVVETKQYYLITFRKDNKKWKQVAVCLA